MAKAPATKRAATRAAARTTKKARATAPDAGDLQRTVSNAVENVLGLTMTEAREKILSAAEKAIPILTAKLDQWVDGSGEWTTPSGRTLIYCPFMEWNGYQDKRALDLHNRARDLTMESHGEHRLFTASTAIKAMVDAGMLEEFLSLVYVPKDRGYYDPAEADTYREELNFMPRRHKMGALYFFLRSSGGGTLDVIRTFLPEGMTRTLIEYVASANVNASSTPPR